LDIVAAIWGWAMTPREVLENLDDGVRDVQQTAQPSPEETSLDVGKTSFATGGVPNSYEGSWEGPPASALRKFGIWSWESIIESDTAQPGSVVENLIEEGSTSLLIARQKEGKSMLSAQMAIDVGSGAPFLGVCETKTGPVLYVDYENRMHRIKTRGLDLAKGRDVKKVHFAAYDRISERKLGLDGANLQRLKEAVKILQPILLIIDPLRLATSVDLMDANKVVPLLEHAAQLQDICPKMAILLVHHLKKGQSDPQAPLRKDPRDWIERAWGSQALLAHVETIIGLEQDGDRKYTLATVPRSYEPVIWALDKERESQRYILAKQKDQLETWPQMLRLNWLKLSDDFSWTEAMNLVGNSTVDRIIQKARPLSLLTQDPITKRYRKVLDSKAKGEEDKDR
jgi:AAA domain